MSKYSNEVRGLIGLGLTRTINEIGARIGNYGAYTYNSIDVSGWVDSLSYYAAIANFLDEYVDGNEELAFEKLDLVTKLSLSSAKAGSASASSTSYTQQQLPILGMGINLLINGVPHPDTPVSLNVNDVCDLKGVYSGLEQIDMMVMTVDSISVAEEATSVFLNNYKINYVGSQTKTVTVYVYLVGNPVPIQKDFIITIIT